MVKINDEERKKRQRQEIGAMLCYVYRDINKVEITRVKLKDSKKGVIVLKNAVTLLSMAIEHG